MDLHRRALLRRALGTAAVVTMAATAVFVAPASADHPHEEEECRKYAPVPNPFVELLAENFKFDTDCLQAPPDRDFRIYLKNNDSEPHNVSIYSADPSDGKAEQLFKGKPVKGPGQEDYHIEGLPPGEYYFQDDKAPDMYGSIEIKEKKKK